MKGQVSVVLVRSAGGFEMKSAGLSAGEARSHFDRLAHSPSPEWLELILLDKVRPYKSRQFSSSTIPAPPPPPAPPLVIPSLPKIASRIIRRGR
jgi:hypothetical protein